MKKKHENTPSQKTSEDFIRSIRTNPELLPTLKEQFHAQGMSLYSICSEVKEPSLVKDMFMMDLLIDEIEKEGKKNELIEKHKEIGPDYTKKRPPSPYWTPVFYPEAQPNTLIGAKTSYTYNPNFPLVNKIGDFLRAGTKVELVRIIETSESVLNPGKTNAPNIPTLLYFDPEKVKPDAPIINIAQGSNKYYCCLCSYADQTVEGGIKSGNYPDTPKALSYTIRTHLNEVLQELRNKNHPLPFMVVHQIGMNNNHVGTVALRICSIEDPSQNEIMVINSLGGYGSWEDAAVEGLTLSLKAFDQEKDPKIYTITPETSGISQVPDGMNSSCSLFTAGVSCYLNPEQSFKTQLPLVKNHMRTFTGKANEAALRRDYQKILALPHPSDPQFDLNAAKEVLKHCERHTTNPQVQTKIDTPEDFIRTIQKNPELLPALKQQLHDQGSSLYSICSKIKVRSVVETMFMLESLMEEIKKEGKKDALIEKHKVIYKKMWPNYTKSQTGSQSPQYRAYQVTNSYEFKTHTPTGGRNYHFYKAAVSNSDRVNVNKKFHGLRGDHLKTEILEFFQKQIEKVQDTKDLEPLKEQLKKTAEYKILSTSQGVYTRITGIPTSSMIAFDKMFEQQKVNIENAKSTQNKM